MIEAVTENSSGVMNFVLGTGGVGAVIWAVAERMLRLRQDRAETGSAVAESRANEALFTMLTNRLVAVEAEVNLLRKELDREREYTRTLVGLMANAGVPIPQVPPSEM